MVAGVIALLAGGLLTYRGVNALTPFWGPGPLPVAGWGLIKVSLFAEILVMGLLAGQLRTRRDLLVSGWLTLAGSALALLVTVVVYSYVFPYPGSSRVPAFPTIPAWNAFDWANRVKDTTFTVEIQFKVRRHGLQTEPSRPGR